MIDAGCVQGFWAKEWLLLELLGEIGIWQELLWFISLMASLGVGPQHEDPAGVTVWGSGATSTSPQETSTKKPTASLQQSEAQEGGSAVLSQAGILGDT